MKGLSESNCLYGFLYTGLYVNNEPYLIEYNVRMEIQNTDNTTKIKKTFLIYL